MTDKRIEYLKQFYDEKELLAYKSKDEERFNQLYLDTQPRVRAIQDIETLDSAYFVESLDGFVPVRSKINKGSHDILEVRFRDGTTIRTSPYHMFERIDNEWISTINLQTGDKLLSGDGHKVVSEIIDTNKKEDIYDLSVDHPNHRYNTNRISSHNSGAGKSLFLQNQALNWAELGLNVVYITLELSEHLTSMRLDAMTTGYGTRDIMKNIEDVSLKVRAFHKEKKGNLQVKQLKNGATANDIRSYIKEYETQTGMKIDAVLVDYLDLCSPIDKRVSPTDLYVKDKYVSEDLRNVAVELDMIMVTASQLNRSSHDEVQFDHSHIAGGISKINTADNVIGIFTTISMKEAGRYQVQFLKTRSSAGVGSKVDLKFNTSSLRITDLDEGEEDSTTAATSSILDTLSKKNRVTDKHDSSDSSSSSNQGSNAGQQAKALRDLVKKNNI